MSQDLPNPWVFTIKDSGGSGLSGPPAATPEWHEYVHRVQTPGPLFESPAETRPISAEVEALPGGGSGQQGSILEGFAAATWVPAQYQERGVKWLASRTAAALFLPPGMGKTSISLAAKEMLSSMGYRSRTLVLAPLTVCLTTWMSEPAKWLQFQGLKVGLAHGPDKELILTDDYYDIVVLNYDGIAWAAPLLVKGHNFDILLCDEIRRLKNTNSKRYKTLKPLLPSFVFRWGLTGTPAANGLMDLFGQCYVLDMGQRLGKFITHFRLKYFHQVPWDQYRYYIHDDKATELVEKISDMAMYMDPKEWLSLPPLLNITLPVELPKDVMVRYKELEDDFLLKLDAGFVTAANAGVLSSKLRQFTGGGILSSPGEWHRVHTSKLNAIESLVDELAGEPLLVAYQFEHEYEMLRELFPSALYIKGGMTKNLMQETVEKWNSGTYPLLLIQPQAGSLGLNLQFGGAAICWFTQTYNLEDFIQQIARLLRRGQEKPVKNYMLIAKGTIDEVIAQVMVEKDATQNNVFENLKRLGAKV
jgi:SNF2-related domain/Helicase conserved C-terminal domain